MLKEIVNTATFKQSQTTIAGTLINGILGALFYILMARFLGPSDFGLLSVSIVTLMLVADILDFGTNTGLVRYVSANIHHDREKAWKFLKLGLEYKILVWLIVLFIGFYLAPQVAEVIFRKSDLVIPLRLVAFGVGGALLLSFATSALQALQKYFIWSIINIFTNFFRLILILTFFFFGQLNLFNGLLLYILLPFFGFFLASFFLPFQKVLSAKNELSVSEQLFRFNVWVGVFTLIAALSSKLDTFLIARLLSNFELGIYGSANQLVQIMPQLIGALGVVAAPKFASFTNNHDMIIYLKKFQMLVLGLALVGLLVIPLAFLLIPAIYGSEYSGAVVPFIILLIAMLVFLISIPIHNSIIYYFGQPQVFVWVSLGYLIITIALGYFLILNFGVVGAASTVLVSTTFGFIAPLTWFLIRIRTQKQ